ncbi:MAG: Asp23/Gls24 family envelope stress response protein [Terracoccus sp.]
MTATMQRSARTRGRLVIDKRVVERIASRAASESGPTGGVSGGLLGLGAHGDLSAAPSAEVELIGQTAIVGLDLTVAYPVPIREATDHVRHHVMERVFDLTGVEVTRVDISVAVLHLVDPSVTRRVL